MHFQSIFLSLLVAGTDACAKYRRCKCHDSGNNLQNDYGTEEACKKYAKDIAGGVSYDANANHSCRKNNDIGGDLMDNCDWDSKCKEVGSQYYQWCWDKSGLFGSKRDDMEGGLEWNA